MRRVSHTGALLYGYAILIDFKLLCLLIADAADNKLFHMLIRNKLHVEVPVAVTLASTTSSLKKQYLVITGYQEELGLVWWECCTALPEKG